MELSSSSSVKQKLEQSRFLWSAVKNAEFLESLYKILEVLLLLLLVHYKNMMFACKETKESEHYLLER